jgi:hypothetical protein
MAYIPRLWAKILDAIEGIIPAITPTMVPPPLPQRKAAMSMPKRHRIAATLSPPIFTSLRPIMIPMPKIMAAAISSKEKVAKGLRCLIKSAATRNTKVNTPDIRASNTITIS